MSRLTEAFRKSRHTSSVSSSPPLRDERAAERESWITTEVPWNFDESPTPALAHAVARSAGIGESRERTLGDSLGLSHEQLLLLVQRLIQPDAPKGRIQSVVFTAVGDDCASAELCAATADALASQTTASVCLVDANFRSPSVRALFGVRGVHGLSDVLLHAADLSSCLTRLQPNLWLLAAGSRCEEALPILLSEQGRPVLVELLAKFDYVVLDTPAAGTHSDTTVLGSLVDGAILVVEADATRREVARRTAEHLQIANIKVLGAVLTNRTFPIPEAIYRKL